MKTDSLQHLLDKYREGTLSESELTELQRLTHRDEVMAVASRRAHAIVRRRRAVAFSVAGLLVASAAVWMLLPQPQATPMIAEATLSESVTVAPEPTVEQVTTPDNPIASPATPKSVAKKAPRVKSEEPVVMCNSQCEADSVISDIWKFLTV